MVNEIKFVTAHDAFISGKFNGTSLVGYCNNLPLDKLAALAAAQGVDATDRNNYFDPESGYDGWELSGTFNDAPFKLYTRFGTLKIGAHMVGDELGSLLAGAEFPALHVDAFLAELGRQVAAL